jgi:excisionase family DNA binding protein
MSNDTTPAKLFYTVPEAAFILNVSQKTVRRWVERGFLSKCNKTRKVLIPRKDVNDFPQKHSRQEWEP